MTLAVLDSETEERLQLFLDSDLQGKLIRWDLGLEDIGVVQQAWNRVLGSSGQGELLKAADSLREWGQYPGLSQDQQKLIVAAKEKLCEFTRDLIQRADLEATVQAKFRGSNRASLRLGLSEEVQSQGLQQGTNGAALWQDSSRLLSAWNGDRAQILYCEDGSAALCVASAFGLSGREHLDCADALTRQIVESLRSYVLPEDLQDTQVMELLSRVSFSGQNQRGKASLLFAKTFATDQPDRVRIKTVQLGYIALLYRHRETGRLTPLTRVGRAGVPERIREGEGHWDPTLAHFDSEVNLTAYEQRLHFGEALLPINGDLIALSDGHLDNVKNLASLEMIFRCPVLDQVYEGASPWLGQPSARALRRFNSREGYQLDDPRYVTQEEAVTRLHHYHQLVVRELKGHSEAVRRLVERKERLIDHWRQLVQDGELSPRQVDDLRRGGRAQTSRGELLEGSKLGELQNQLDEHLEYLDVSPCRLDDYIALAMPVSSISTPRKVSELGQIISTWFS